MRCWLCGAEPEMVNIQTLSEAQPRYIPGQWPAAEDGHTHAVRPPTPDQLEHAGHQALMRIRNEGHTT